MPIFNYRNMGQVGVVSDLAPWDLPDNALSDGRNFRVSAGKIQASGGSKLMSQSGAGSELGHIDQTKMFNGENEWVVCGADGIYVFNGVAFDKIYSVSGLNPDLWSTCKIGRVIFFNHPDHMPLFWISDDEQLGAPEPLPWSPTVADWQAQGCKARVLASHRNFLFAMNTTEIENGETNYYTDRIRWSHPVEPNGIPYTWEPANNADKSSLAGYVTLGRGGEIIGGESMRDAFVVYSAEAVNILDYTGDALMWRRRTVSQTAGLIGKEAVEEVRGNHYFMAADDIIIFDGNQAQSLLHNRLRKRYANTIDTVNLKNSFCFHNKTFNEIWFCYPEKGHTYPTTALAYNYRDNTMAIRDLSLEKEFRHAHYGKTTGSDLTWNTVETEWSSERSSWRLGGQNPFDGMSLAVSGDNVYNVDTQTPDEDITTFVERQQMPVAGHDTNTTVTRLYPQVEGSSTVKVSVGSHQHAGDGVAWAKPVDFTASEDRKVDIRSTGELHSFKVEGKAKDNFNLTGFDVEFALAGKR
jgi:hypothetical protein